MVDLNKVKLGCIKSHKDPRTFRAARYVKANLPTPPQVIDYTSKPEKDGRFKLYGNDKMGCCTAAAIGNLDNARDFTVGLHTSLTDSDVLEAYIAVTAQEGAEYNPKTGENDNGCQPIDMLKYWRKKGKVLAYAKIDPSDHQLALFVCWAFGGVYTAVGLPNAAKNQDYWDVKTKCLTGKNYPGSWGGHMIPITSMTATDDMCTEIKEWKAPTWGYIQSGSGRWLKNYCNPNNRSYGEMWMVITPEQFDKRTGLAASGFDFEQLEKDLAALKK